MRYLFSIIFIFLCGILSAQIRIDMLKQTLDTISEKNKAGRIDVLNRLAEAYLSISPEKAEETAKEALDLIDAQTNPLLEAQLNNTLGAAYYYQEKYRRSMRYYKRELELLKQANRKHELLRALFNIATLYRKLEKYRHSKAFYEQSLTIAQEVNATNLIVENYQALYEVCSEDNSYENALQYYKVYEQLLDSLNWSKTRHQITILKSQYKQAVHEKEETEHQLRQTDAKLHKAHRNQERLIADTTNKAREIKELNVETEEQKQTIKEKEQKVIKLRRWMIFLATIITIIAVFSFLLNRQYRLKKRAYQQLEKHHSEILTQKAELEKQREEIKNKSEQIEQQNEELKALNATKDKFFSIIAHDLKNPFSTLIISSETLLKNFASMENIKIRRYLDSIHRSSKHGYNLLENLLDWSRSQTGRLQIKPEAILIKQIVNDSIRLLHNYIHNKMLQVNLRLPEEYLIYADYNMITTIIRNLLTNAIKFTPAEGKIFISAQPVCRLKHRKNSESQRFIALEIEDTGVGMKPDVIDKLFRIDTSHSTLGTNQEKGTGLGLILCKEFVEKNNGTIEVESVPKEGSIFRVFIPEYVDLQKDEDGKALLRDGKEKSDFIKIQKYFTKETESTLSTLKPEILHVLETKFRKQYKEINTSKSIRTIYSFAQELNTFACNNTIDFLANYSAELKSHAENFDVEKINSTLDLFPICIEKINEQKTYEK